MKRASVTHAGKIRARIDVPGVSVDINTDDSLSALREVRKILDSLRNASVVGVEGEYEDIGVESSPRQSIWSLSEEARSNDQFMEFVKLASKAEEQCQYRRISVPNKRVIDVAGKKIYATLELDDIKKSVLGALHSIEPSRIAFVAVHVMGTISDEEKNTLCTVVAEHLVTAEVKTCFTHKDVLGKTVAEILLFGPMVTE